MKTHLQSNGTVATLRIEGHITGVAEVLEIKTKLSTVDFEILEITVKDAFVIPSALIGYLVKIVQKDGVKVMFNAQQDSLKTLISDLNLDAVFEVR